MANSKTMSTGLKITLSIILAVIVALGCVVIVWNVIKPNVCIDLEKGGKPTSIQVITDGSYAFDGGRTEGTYEYVLNDTNTGSNYNTLFENIQKSVNFSLMYGMLDGVWFPEMYVDDQAYYVKDIAGTNEKPIVVLKYGDYVDTKIQDKEFHYNMAIIETYNTSNQIGLFNLVLIDTERVNSFDELANADYQIYKIKCYGNMSRIINVFNDIKD